MSDLSPGIARLRVLRACLAIQRAEIDQAS